MVANYRLTCGSEGVEKKLMIANGELYLEQLLFSFVGWRIIKRQVFSEACAGQQVKVSNCGSNLQTAGHLGALFQGLMYRSNETHRFNILLSSINLLNSPTPYVQIPIFELSIKTRLKSNVHEINRSEYSG